MKEQIEIKLSKKKILLLLFGATAFVAFGIVGTINPETWVSPMHRNETFIRLISILCVSFFGVCLINIIRKLFDNRIGLTINEDGIIENTNNSSVGLINWEDIIGFEIVKIKSTKIIFVKTKKPDKYIERANSWLHKNFMKSNKKTAGTPISINPGVLKIKSDELEELLRTEFEKRKNKATNR
jgi:hypothetical protein